MGLAAFNRARRLAAEEAEHKAKAAKSKAKNQPKKTADDAGEGELAQKQDKDGE